MAKTPAQEAFPPIPAGHAFGRIFVHTEEVTGSIPVPPTTESAGRTLVLAAFTASSETTSVREESASDPTRASRYTFPSSYRARRSPSRPCP